VEIQPVIDAIVKLCAAVLMACAPIVAAYAVKVLKAKLAELEAKLSTEQITQLRYITSLAVRAAEQMNLGDQINDKKGYALDLAESWLKSRGVNLDINAIEAAVESAVMTEAFPHAEIDAAPPPAETHGSVFVGSSTI
jgi:hypothetical protein